MRPTSFVSTLLHATLAGGTALALLALTSPAEANPRPLPFTYQSESLAKGTGEIEQFIDFVPIRANAVPSGTPVTYLSTQYQTEFEYGLTDKLEIALYLTFVPTASVEEYMGVPVFSLGNGSAQRVRYRFADPGAWPIDVAVYGEVTESQREIELEGKVILQRRIGKLRLITNLWGEREMYFSGNREWVLNPTLGATYEFTPKFHLGFEGWMRAEYLDSQHGTRTFNQGPHVFVGPAFMFNFGPVWWATGAYARVSDPSHDTQIGDAYGRIWIRTVVGLGF